jgi:hypothetical protein
MDTDRLTSDELVGALDALDVPFLVGGIQDEAARALTPAELMEGLAQSPEARVRSALIPLLLRHPEFAEAALLAAGHLQPPARYTLELSYTAALLLQRKYAERLSHLLGVQPDLPDLFSKPLGIELPEDGEVSLQRLGQRHAQLTGLDLNWIATYEHAAKRLIKHFENRERWAQREQAIQEAAPRAGQFDLEPKRMQKNLHIVRQMLKS